MKKRKRFRLIPKILFLSLIMSLAIPVFAFAASTYPAYVDSTGYGYLEYHVDSSGNYYVIALNDSSSKFYLHGSMGAVSGTAKKYVWNGSSWDYSTSYTNTDITSYLATAAPIVYGTVPYYSDNTFTTQLYTPTVVDTVAPNEVSNVVSSNISDTSITLNWGASTSSDVTAYQIYKGIELLGTTSLTTYTVSGLSPITAYDFVIKAVDGSNNISSGVAVNYSTVAAPTNPPGDTGSTGDTGSNQGGDNMTPTLFTSLTASGITTEATNWANNFDTLLLVVVGVGLGFAAVRFVKGLFF